MTFNDQPHHLKWKKPSGYGMICYRYQLLEILYSHRNFQTRRQSWIVRFFVVGMTMMSSDVHPMSCVCLRIESSMYDRALSCSILFVHGWTHHGYWKLHANFDAHPSKHQWSHRNLELASCGMPHEDIMAMFWNRFKHTCVFFKQSYVIRFGIGGW